MIRFKDLPIATRMWTGAGVSILAFSTATWIDVHAALTAPAGEPVSTWLLVLPVVVAAAATAAASWVIARGVVNPFHRAVDVAVSIARGKLDNQFSADSRDEFGWLLHELREMQKSLAKSVLKIRDAAETINCASGEIAAGSSDLSSRTEAQAASLQQASSSMDQLTTVVRNNVERAHSVNGLANSAAEVARRGGSVVSEVVRTMSDINTSASRIVDIISVIDGIAFQTNILALNAAVEAARAGELGRGFAVVAAEVRSLAQRSATAAREIKGLINDSVEKIGAGARLVDSAGTTMDEIVKSIEQVSHIMRELAEADASQSGSIEQINATVSQMDQTTQQNAAMVEQTAAAAMSMKQQAATLAEVVGQFQLATA